MTTPPFESEAERRARINYEEEGEWFVRARALHVAAEIEGAVGGRHFTEWAETIRQLKRDGHLEEALALCYECIDAVEREAMVDQFRMPAWYTEQAAITHRKLGQLVEEVAVLQRYGLHVFGDPSVFEHRIAAAFRLMARATSKKQGSPPAFQRGTARHRA